MRKHATEVNHIVEQLEQATSFGTHPAIDHATTARGAFDELFSQDDRFNDAHAVMGKERRDFAPDRSQWAVLNLDQLIAPDSINAEASESDLRAVVGFRVEGFQLPVQ